MRATSEAQAAAILTPVHMTHADRRHNHLDVARGVIQHDRGGPGGPTGFDVAPAFHERGRKGGGASLLARFVQ